MEQLPDWYESTLAAQREETAQTWDALRERGIDEQVRLRLEFFFDAPDRASVELLATLLARHADYDLATTPDETEANAGPGWLLRGRTAQITLSGEILDTWVSWMVRSGAENGACQFAGWGTSLAQ